MKDTLLRKQIRFIFITIASVFIFSLTAFSSTPNMETLSAINWNLEFGKEYLLQTYYPGLGMRNIKVSFYDYNRISLKNGYDQITFKRYADVTQDLSEEEAKRISEVIGEQDFYVHGVIFVDYNSGKKNVEDYGVTIKRKQTILETRKYYYGGDGRYFIMVKEQVEYTITMPSTYDGLCFGVAGTRRPCIEGKDDRPEDTAYYNGTGLYSASSYYDPNNKSMTIFMRIRAHSHTYGEWKTIKEATETSEGTEERTCTSCGESETRSIPKIVLSISISKAPASVKAKAKKNKVTVTWKKIKKTKKTKKLLAQIKSVQVQYSTDPAFEQNIETKTVGKKKTKAVLKLQNKMVYFIRVRYVGADGVSRWSKVRKVKTK